MQQIYRAPHILLALLEFPRGTNLPQCKRTVGVVRETGLAKQVFESKESGSLILGERVM